MSDNLQLSDPTLRHQQERPGRLLAGSFNPASSEPTLCTEEVARCVPTTDMVSFYLAASQSENTRKAYASDLQHFYIWGGTIPSSAETLAEYLAESATILAVSTLKRRIAAIAWAHRHHGHDDPTKSELVRKLMRGIERHHGFRPSQAQPLLLRDIENISLHCGRGLQGLRDVALLLLGYFGAFRASELTGLNIEDCIFERTGLLVHLGRSKTDQRAKGRWVRIPSGREPSCPVRATRKWLISLGRTDGPLFPSITRSGLIREAGITARSLSRIIAMRASDAGINTTGLSSHSLRAGYVTEALWAGMDPALVARQTGHSTVEMVMRYLRDRPSPRA
ncbi:MAG TPA: integrase [Rhodobiaceae bacterium]|nr:integrase [Rhodobiaceae bacterium]